MGHDSSCCRDIIRGIRAYARTKNWVFHNAPSEPEILPPCRKWKPHGVVAYLSTREMARRLLKINNPLVDIACVFSDLGIPAVDVNHLAVGRLAAEYLLERGFRRFGFYGNSWAYCVTLREAGFRERVAESGYAVVSCHTDCLPYMPRPSSWKTIDPRVQKWLTKLPKPVAILASNNAPGRDLADICRLLGLRVPEDVAIIGVDNDDLECELASPPLSSVAIPSLQIGCEAARLLDRLMAGEPPPAAPIFLPPIGVVTRPSTDILMIEDRDVAAALSFIRLHAGEEINVKAVSQAVAVGRRTLEAKFRACCDARFSRRSAAAHREGERVVERHECADAGRCQGLGLC